MGMTIIESIGPFRLSIDTEDQRPMENRVMWRAKSDCGLCFAGFIDPSVTTEELRKIAVDEVLRCAVKSAGFLAECVRVKKEREVG